MMIGFVDRRLGGGVQVLQRCWTAVKSMAEFQFDFNVKILRFGGTARAKQSKMLLTTPPCCKLKVNRPALPGDSWRIHKRPKRMNDFQTVCKIGDLQSEGKTVVVGNRCVALFLIEGKPADDDACPPRARPSRAATSRQHRHLPTWRLRRAPMARRRDSASKTRSYPARRWRRRSS